MPKFVVARTFIHEHVVHPGGEMLDLNEYEARKFGSAVERVGQRGAATVKQESAKAEEQKAESRTQKAAEKASVKTKRKSKD